MFWRFGGYANISAIDTILDKPEFTLEELLDESDLIQELKQHNSKLLDYLRQKEVLDRLLEYVVAPKLEPVAVPEESEDNDRGKGRLLSFSRPRASSRATTEGGSDEEEAEKKRNKYAYVACEVLSSDNWSIFETLMQPSCRDLLQRFWQFLGRPTPLDPLQASYFTKVNESLFDRKTDEMVEFLKTVDGAVGDMLRHVDCPMIMDLLLKIISLERTDSGQGIVEWLYTQDLMPSLLSFLDPKHSWATQTSAGDFMKAIITVSANASQNEQTCIGPNELTRQLVSKPCVEQLIGYMLGGGNALTVGVGIVIEVIRKNNSDYDPDVGAEANSAPSSRDPIYLGTLLRMFAENVPNFMKLIMNTPAQKARLDSTFGEKIEPLGFDRFKTCELMAELLHCSNMGLLNEVGSEELIATRDAERRRLRAEGKLSTMRGEEPPSSVEDLTMRMSHSSPSEEIRRLEVTNVSDDDGFEEVTHSGELGEEHEFVKAEEEIQRSLPASSLLDKDEDDFVEEPLSSPRLHVRDEKMEDEVQFDEPDLVVAPLSPSKSKPAGSHDGDCGVEDAQQEMKNESGEPRHGGTSEKNEGSVSDFDKIEGSDSIIFAPTISSMDLSSAPPTPESVPAQPEQPQHPPSVTARDLSPHPEDTPAPLFARDAPQMTPSTSDTSSAASSTDASDENIAESKENGSNDADAGDADAGDASIIVGHEQEPAPQAGGLDSSQAKPVVGDYLKMQFVEHRVVPTILSFFFGFPWNNFLHNVVYDIVQQVFNGPMDRGYNPTLAISLFESADITTQIINGQLASERSQAQNKTRMGYMGHLTLIAEEVVKFTERHPPELLSEVVLEKVMSQDWINYVEGALAETRERDNAILGGVRPEVAMNNRQAAGGLAAVGLGGLGSALALGGPQSASSALAEAGLNGGLDMHSNGDGSAGPFSISAGISSGFHSSSDEDEDDQDDSEEDVNNEFRAYTDPLLNTLASLTPPSIPPPPPPPPPLNIPPSRARLQLAARLAMNKRNAEAAAAHENGSSGDGSDEAEPGSENKAHHPGLLDPAPVERLRNPFADDEDDDEDGDDDADDGNLVGAGEGHSSGGAWNRGGWWRGMVRPRPRRDRESERFGDGRDDSSSGEEEDDDVEDEEFGDFAMPEVGKEGEGSGKAGTSNTGASSGTGRGAGGNSIDREREKVLFKPLAVHPPSAGVSKFGGLWPFDGLGFGAINKERGEKRDEGELSAAAAAAAADKRRRGDVDEDTTMEEPEVVISEDGHRVSRVTEATRRTSLEDPDEDDEIIV